MTGLIDRRRGRPSPKRVPLAEVEQVLELYREKYFDLNVRHFHEKLGAEHGIGWSYTWVKRALQGSGLVAKGRKKRGVHRQRRARRALPGMLLHIDGSHHPWFGDERWYDLIVILDDASSQIYYAQLVEEESTATVMAGLREVIERQGLFCALYSDRGSHFWLTPKAGGKVDAHRLTQVGRALHELGVRMIPAYSPQARGRSERSFGTWQGRLPQELRLRGITTVEAANRFLREHYISEFNGRFQVAPAPPGSAFVACRRKDLDLIFALQFAAHGEPGQHGELPEPGVADRAGELARDLGRLQRHGSSAPGWNHQPHSRAAPAGILQCPGRGPHSPPKRGAKSCGTDAPWKSQKADFSTALGNPAQCAGFPRFQRRRRLVYESTPKTKTGHLTCYENRTF